jgi:hypothetical protein
VAKRTLSSGFSGATMAGEIELWCILKSDTSSQSVFPVSILVDGQVGHLREAIKSREQFNPRKR